MALISVLAFATPALSDTAGHYLQPQAMDGPSGWVTNDYYGGTSVPDECWTEGAYCPSCWRVTVDALYLDRSDPRGSVLIENTADPTENLNAGDLDLGGHTGVDVSLVEQLGGCWDLEVRYFGLDHWSAAATTPTTPGDLLQLNTAVPLFLEAGTSIDARYTSELHNFELNLLREVNERITLLAGFRYLELDEHLRLTLVNAATPFDMVVNTRNRLYGFQLGGHVRIWESCCCEPGCCVCRCGRFTIDGVGKAGIYGNQPARVAAITTTRPLEPSSTSVSGRAAFVGELGITGTYRFCNCFSLRGGYRLLWIDGVALASDQVAATAFLPPALAPRPTMDLSNVFYHGAFIGLQYQW